MPAIEDPPPLTQAYMDNSRWMLDHLPDLAQSYPNQWIAVYRGQVLAANSSLQIVHEASASVESPSDVVFHFVDDGSLIF